jgi:replicative DNA helicase
VSSPERIHSNGHSPPRVPEGPIAPPQNLEAEQSVLGAVLLSDTALPALIIDERLHPEDFYREAHGTVFAAMLDLHNGGEPVDALTLVEHLKQAGRLEEAGGRAAIDLLASSVPAVGHVRQYARIVRENAMLRRLLRAAYEIQARVHSHDAPPRELVDIAERSILEVAHEDSRKDFRAINDVLDVEITKLEQLSQEGKSITGTPSGFDDLDNITGGFQPGNLIVLAARPSMGKCLAGSTSVYDPRDGRRRRIDELVAAYERGEELAVLSLDARRELRPSRVSAAIRSGVQPVFRLTTRRGNSIDATASHPFLTESGWRELATLGPGHGIAAASDLAHAAAHRFALHGRAREGRADSLAARVARPDVAWDTIISIEELGERETYDLTVPGDHNFVANDLIVHNSALMANFAENAALGAKKAVALFSLEMSESELAQRFIASQASIKGDDLRKGRVPAARWGKIMEASNRLAKSPLYIDDSSDLSVLDVRAKARRLLQQHPDGLGLILIDYLQLMRGDGRADNRVEQIGQISRGLKTLARELDCPVVALSQLNRGVEQRTDKRPVLSDLRESGSIEQDADLVMFIYRDEYYDRESEREGIADVIISKHRNGGLGDVELTFQKEYPRFMSYVGDDRY